MYTVETQLPKNIKARNNPSNLPAVLFATLLVIFVWEDYFIRIILTYWSSHLLDAMASLSMSEMSRNPGVCDMMMRKLWPRLSLDFILDTRLLNRPSVSARVRLYTDTKSSIGTNSWLLFILWMSFRYSYENKRKPVKNLHYLFFKI